jgi:hypothetical protein
MRPATKHLVVVAMIQYAQASCFSVEYSKVVTACLGAFIIICLDNAAFSFRPAARFYRHLHLATVFRNTPVMYLPQWCTFYAL